jgi:hypothetical protein
MLMALEHVLAGIPRNVAEMVADDNRTDSRSSNEGDASSTSLTEGGPNLTSSNEGGPTPPGS